MHSAYIKSHPDPNDMEAAILFIVQPNERNVLDQVLIEFELFETYGINSFRLSLNEVQEKTKMVEGKRLYHDNSGYEISVLYYRSGYSPTDYPTETEWQSRLYLECSYSIKCPSVLTQLSGAKKVQQLLSDEQVIKKVAPSLSQANINDLLETFVEIHPFDDSTPEGRHARKLAFDQPQNYVLKPQREGGGNNVYRDNIPGFLTTIPKSSWSSYILMELINPPTMSNKILRNGQVHNGEIVSELGVFGACLWNMQTKENMFNETSGWLLRSKLKSSDEGGVAAGFGCIDGVYLVD